MKKTIYEAHGASYAATAADPITLTELIKRSFAGKQDGQTVKEITRWVSSRICVGNKKTFRLENGSVTVSASNKEYIPGPRPRATYTS